MAVLAQEAVSVVHQSGAVNQAELEQTEDDEAEGEALQAEPQPSIQEAPQYL